MTLSWDFSRHPAKGNSRKRPFATVALANDNGDRTPWHKFVLVDSGSEETLFPRSYLPSVMKLDFSANHPDQGKVIWRGVTIPLWYHQVEIILADGLHADGSPIRKITGRGRVGFWPDRDANGKLISFLPYPVLGQYGTLEYLVFTEYAGQELFELKPDANGKPPWTEM